MRSPPQTHTNTEPLCPVFAFCSSKDQEIPVVANNQKSRRQRPVSDGQAPALLWASATSPYSSQCVCVCWGTSRSWAAPIVSCEMQGSGVAGNRQRLWRCAASGGSALCRWPERLFSWPTQLAVAEAPFCHCWLWVGVFPLAPSLPLLLPLFQHWLRNRGVRGHEGLDDGEGGLSGKLWPFCVH